MTQTPSLEHRIWNSLSRISIAGWVALAVSVLGLVLRLEHAITFDGPSRGSDYAANVGGVYWMLNHWRPFDFTNEVGWSVRYQPPLWSAVSAVVLKFTNSERAIAYVAVYGWAIRQWLLSRIVNRMAPTHPWSSVAALSVNAILPVSVLTDGKVNPENYHTTLFTIAVYFLWRMERQAGRSPGISYRTAAIFGLFSGLSILTKGSASVLLMSAAVLIVWQFRHISVKLDWVIAFRRLFAPSAVAAFVFFAVAGWWILPNVVKWHHPFPHIWDTQGPKEEPILAEPFFYRRPLGWALPFEWKEYVDLPINKNGKRPRPNYWASTIAGTWTDWYNRGFCRLPGEEGTTEAWGGWTISARCVSAYKKLMWLGISLTLMALYSVVRMARSHLQDRDGPGSLVLPCIIVLGAVFPGLFALGYPYDHLAVLNPRYLLPISTPMAACLGIVLSRFKKWSAKGIVAYALVLGTIASAAVLVVYERFGK